jgi:H+/Cl- antiporter ClcA
VLAGLVAVAVFGNKPTSAACVCRPLSWSLLLPGLLVALVAGLSGGLFARLIVVSVRGLPDRFSRWRSTYPLRFAAGCGLAVAVIGLATQGATAGAGYLTTRGLLEGQATAGRLHAAEVLRHLDLGLVGRAGGCLCAVAGHRRRHRARRGPAHGREPEAAIPLIAMGMAGFLAATTGGRSRPSSS